MKLTRDSQLISGFVYEDPVDDLPCLTHCGEALCVEGHRLSSHMHRGFEFLYLSRGSATWRFGDRRIPQQMGDIVIAHPRELHRTWSDNPQTYQLWIGLQLDDLGQQGRRLAALLARTDCHLLAGCYEADPLLRGLVHQVVDDQPKRREVILSYIQIFLSLLEQWLEVRDSAHGAASQRRPVAPYSAPVRKAITFMEQNLDRRLPLRDIAAVAAIRSVPHFCSKFHREVGQPPGAFHLKLRLDAAAVLLRQPDASVTLAAHEYGFSSSQHFSAQFRKLFNVSPRQWIARGSGGANSLLKN